MVLQLHYRTKLNEIINNHIEIGVEVEKHRVGSDKRLSLKPFPEKLSASLTPYVKREFCTSQLEFAMPHSTNPDLIVDLLSTVIKNTAQQLEPDEQLWHYSCPPELSCRVEDIPISQYPKESTEYRRQSCLRYDARRLLNNGTHINLSFSPEAMSYLMKELNYLTSDDLYIQIAQYFMFNRWLLTYLFGATPFAGHDYFDHNPLNGPVRSIRSSSLGFANDTRGDYRSAQHYITAIDRAVARGDLLQPREYYESVRLKSGDSKDPHRILEHGITHLELRTFDLNPLAISAVTVDQIRLIQVLILYFAYQPRLSGMQVKESLAVATIMNEHVALESPTERTAYAVQGLDLLADVADFIKTKQLGGIFEDVIDRYRTYFLQADWTLAAQVLEKVEPY